MILLAGINRGWSMDPKPKHTPFLIYLIYRAFSLLTTVIPICRLSRSFYRGEPFVENLRIQWHRLERSEPIPPTIQLYGREEDVVTCEDMTDIQFCSHFIFLDVPGTGHFNAANFHQKDLGPRRRRRFLEALKSPIPTLLEQPKLKLPERTKDVTEELVGQNNLEVNDVVFVIHGIRDFGDWTLELPKCIEQIASEKGLRVLVNSPAYKRFPMLRFLLGRSRRKNVRWFVDKYVTALARYPNARFHFIGHSNGTYLLADALQRYDSMRFHRVAFAGSVVRRAYPWDAIFDAGRVTAVRNDRSANDWVVAVFPRFFEQFWEVTGISLGNIGSAGVFGFQDNAGRRHQTLIRGGHGAAIDPKNHPSLVRYILGIDDRPTLDPGVEVVERIPRAIHWLAALSWLWWLILVGSAGLLVCWLLISGHPGLAAASLIAIWWLLNTL
jgi:pimeloyl-ACP methyl ester carboxylesterase